MTTNDQKAHKFLQFINDNYKQLYSKMEAYCNSNGLDFDYDIYADTYIKIYDKIVKDGLDDDTEAGMLNYFFKSFKTNTLREKMYARNQKRDLNVQGDDLYTLYENWYNDNNVSEMDKLVSDLYKDFAAVYICEKVEKEFDSEHFNLFRMKMFGELTYKQLAAKTQSKGVRAKVLAVKNWAKEHITKDEIKQAFWDNFSEIIC